MGRESDDFNELERYEPKSGSEPVKSVMTIEGRILKKLKQRAELWRIGGSKTDF